MDLFCGDSAEVLKSLPSNSVESLITDPPAGITFMGKDWDKDKGGRDAWIAWMTEVMKECHRVLKPGAHGLVWALPRTSHWTGMALDVAGFEVRDSVISIFGSGFPKSRDISKDFDKMEGANRNVVGTYKVPGLAKGNVLHGAQNRTKFEFEKLSKEPVTAIAKHWEGWGTALKPAHEVWWLVRKPLSEKTVAQNVLKHGTGGLNIDASRIETVDAEALTKNWRRSQSEKAAANRSGAMGLKAIDLSDRAPTARFPANLVLSHNEDCGDTCVEDCAVKGLDEHSGVLSKPGNRPGNLTKRATGKNVKFNSRADYVDGSTFQFGDSGGASRFFYVAKASKRDKGEGNSHPTVKSTALMEYLIKLITPPGGIVLDPFMGSGSTGVAAERLGFGFVGIEKEAEYFEIAKARIGVNLTS